MNAAENRAESNGSYAESPAARVYRLPQGKIVRRARDWYLYDQDGTRYVDFWQADGTAFLGHRPDGHARLAKAEIDRGLWTPVPTPWPARLERALGQLAGAMRPGSPPRLDVVNGRPAAARPGVTRWLPAATAPSGDIWQLVLPAPGVVVPAGTLPSDLSAVQSALLTRATHNLLAYLSSSAMERRVQSAVETALPPGYTRDGAWFVPNASDGAAGAVDGAGAAGENAAVTDLRRWNGFVDRALSYGVLLPPDPWTPIPIPGEIQTTDQKKWESVCNEWPQ